LIGKLVDVNSRMHAAAATIQQLGQFYMKNG